MDKKKELQLSEILKGLEIFFETRTNPTLGDLKRFVANNLIKKSACDKKILQNLQTEFKNKEVSEKYDLLLQKYLDLQFDTEIYYYLFKLYKKDLDLVHSFFNDEDKKLV